MMIINTKAKKKERFIDLALLLEDKSHITYVCKECGTDLTLNSEYQINNAFRVEVISVIPVIKHMTIRLWILWGCGMKRGVLTIPTPVYTVTRSG